MNKKILIIISSLILLASIISAFPNNKVNIVVVGMINHGPMQPTVNAIKEVASKYPNVNVRWLDLESSEGQNYAFEHELTAHLNILINEKYRYNIDRKEVTFQWFEGQQWTKRDLDSVISNILNGEGHVAPTSNAKNKGLVNKVIIFLGIFTFIVAVVWFLIKRFRKR